MHTAPDAAAPPQGQAAPADWPDDPQIETDEPRNLLLLATHQIVLRVGWIFKTESVILPAFVDWVAGSGAGALRGCLPVLNRLGQSLPPVFCVERLRATRRKKHALATFALLMSVPFGLLSWVCFATAEQQRLWMALLFLAVYFVFFLFNGLYHVSFGTVQGRLIRPTRRGRLLVTSTALGTIPASLFAWWLLRGWLARPHGGFGCIFAFTAVCFFLSGLVALLLSEPADESQPRKAPLRATLRGARDAVWSNLADTRRVLRRDANLRRLVLVAMLSSTGLMLTPHYQALALGPLGLQIQGLVAFVIAQNVAVGAYSLFVGPLADAWGNRLMLRALIFAAAAAPLSAISFYALGGQTGGRLYWMVFIPLGITPLVLRILINYTLETCQPAEHPRYLSTVLLCLAAPFVFSPVVGWLVEAIGYPTVFLATAGLIVLGGCLTFRLDEPRHRVPSGEIAPLGAAGEE